MRKDESLEGDCGVVMVQMGNQKMQKRCRKRLVNGRYIKGTDIEVELICANDEVIQEQ